MSKKLRPNFTPIPNVILDEIMRTLAPGTTKLLFAICRFTYGWGKQSDRISISQLEDITGMARGSVARSIKQLGKLVSIKPGDPSRQLASEYRLNIEISDNDLVSLRDQAPVSERDQASLLASLIKRPSKDNQRKEEKTGAKAPDVSSPSRRGRKLTRPDPAQVEAFARFYEAYPRHVGKADALDAWIELAPGPELVAEIMAGVERYTETVKDSEPKFIKHPGPWLNARRWEDEPAGGNGAGNGTAKPEIKDLGDGYFEVDGRRMDRQTAERRYGKRAI